MNQPKDYEEIIEQVEMDMTSLRYSVAAGILIWIALIALIIWFLS